MTEAIDNILLISLVRKRPVIWDKSLSDFKDRNATKTAWEEVCSELRNDYDELNDGDKNIFGIEVMKRWKNLRDAFAKSEKNKNESGRGKRRRYIFYHELQFLNPTNDGKDSTERDIGEEESPKTRLKPSRNSVSAPNSTIVKRRRLEEVQTPEVVDHKQSETPNRQLAFFQSLLTHTENFSNEEWLHFQMEILRVISGITLGQYESTQD